METLTIETVVDANLKFKPDVLRAAKVLAAGKPWAGDFDRRFDLLADCLRALCEAHGLKPIQLTHVGDRVGFSGGSRFRPNLRRVELTGRLSVVTMFQLFAIARAVDDVGDDFDAADLLAAIRWSVTLFRRVFPISFSRCEFDGRFLTNKTRRND